MSFTVSQEKSETSLTFYLAFTTTGLNEFFFSFQISPWAKHHWVAGNKLPTRYGLRGPAEEYVPLLLMLCESNVCHTKRKRRKSGREKNDLHVRVVGAFSKFVFLFSELRCTQSLNAFNFTQ
jgi:hypothetical protein